MSDPDDWRAWIAKVTSDLLNIENNEGHLAAEAAQRIVESVSHMLGT